MCIVLGCTIFLFLYGSIWYMVFLFFFFWLFNYYLYFCRFIFFLVFLLPPRSFIFSFAFIQVLIHFHLFASFIGLLCVLYASVFLVSFSFPFSRSRVFAFPKFLIYHECMHDCCLEIHCALIRIAIAYYK